MLAMTCLLGAAGCGGASKPKSDADQIRATYATMVRDARAGDWKGVCDQLAPDVRARLASAGALAGSSSCADVLAMTAARSGNPLATGGTLTDISVNGSHATAHDSGAAPGSGTEGRFIKVAGRWYVDADTGS